MSKYSYIFFVNHCTEFLIISIILIFQVGVYCTRVHFIFNWLAKKCNTVTTSLHSTTFSVLKVNDVGRYIIFVCSRASHLIRSLTSRWQSWVLHNIVVVNGILCGPGNTHS